MEGFTLTLALVDAIPVLFFGGSMLLVASRFPHPLFLIGACISTLAGCCKVLWKLILGIWQKDLRWLNKPFVPMQAAGFLIMLVSFLLGFKSIDWSGVWKALVGFPCCVLFLMWLGLMFAMGWYRKNRFSHDSAKSNWAAQFINCAAQGSLFLALLLSR